MTRFNMIPGVVLALFVMTSHCGTGGIVDNGNKPEPTPETKPAPDVGQNTPSSTIASLDVLGTYRVMVPSGSWSASSSSTTTTISNGTKSVVFSYTANHCDVASVKNLNHVDRYTCSSSQTILAPSDGRFISATYTELDSDVEIILNTFTLK